MNRFGRFEAGLLFLLLAAAWLLAPVLGFGFLTYDDPAYVTRNPHVADGLSWGTVAWALAGAHAGNWHPLTWLSHALDVTAFGLAPRGHHAVNLALHLANVGLVYATLRALTAQPARSLAVAALFALHPLQIESVAWVAERKNLLSTAFGLLAVLAYARSARRPDGPRMTAVGVWLALSLLSKAMWVTLPFLLLLLDVWPLARAEPLARRLREKTPLFALAAAASVATYAFQADAGAMDPAATLGLGARLAHLPLAYAGYLAHAFWPVGLAVLYPHPLLAEGASLPWSAVAAATAGLLAVTGGAAFFFLRGLRAPLVGWLWFVGMLVPVIGLVQVGWQGIADRYVYVPGIGLGIAVVWGVAAVLPGGAARTPTALALSLAVAAGLAAATRAQLPPWRASIPLFEHAIAVTGPNPVMHNELGIALGAERRTDEAREAFETAARLAPGWSVPLQNLGASLRTSGRPEEALAYLERSVALDPDQGGARLALANALLDLGRVDAARPHLEHALALDPDDPRARLVRARLEREAAR